jgi:carbohydrate kinase (thermoresistant glucokinase family)
MAAEFLAGRVVVVMGVSGCGKSQLAAALARHFDVPFVEADDFHTAENIAKMASGIPLQDGDRWPWLDAVSDALAKAGSRGVIGACSALRVAYRDRLRLRIARPLTFLHLEVREDVVETRIARREGHFMRKSLLASQLATLERVENESGVFSLDADRPPNEVLAEAVRMIETGGSRFSARLDRV